jgi:hypothetical protein
MLYILYVVDFIILSMVSKPLWWSFKI